jgi:hypothetical protein
MKNIRYLCNMKTKNLYSNTNWEPMLIALAPIKAQKVYSTFVGGNNTCSYVGILAKADMNMKTQDNIGLCTSI